MDLKPEAPLEIAETQPSDDWPQKGSLKFENVSARYRENLDLVLKGVSFEVKGGQKVGVCGRTGAGKSSLTMVRFDIFCSHSGRLLISCSLCRSSTVSLRPRVVSFPSTASTSPALDCTRFALACPSSLKTRSASRGRCGRTWTRWEGAQTLRFGRRWRSAG